MNKGEGDGRGTAEDGTGKRLATMETGWIRLDALEKRFGFLQLGTFRRRVKRNG
jgi:hypothetical protein